MSDVTMPLRPPAPPTPTTGQLIGSLLLNLVLLAVLLYIFLWAIALFGAAFKLMGKGFSEQLIATTSNPVVGLMIGLLATSLIQSSSSSTSIVVGMVSGGVLTVRGAIPIIMGANMGTTVTNTLVAMTAMNRRKEFQLSFAGATMHDFFNLMAIAILFPIEQATHYLERTAGWISLHLAGAEGTEFPNPIKVIVKPAVKQTEYLLKDVLGLPNGLETVLMIVLALVGIFVALTFLTRILKGLVLGKAEGSFIDKLNSSGLAAMLMGLLITISVQSSSITTSLMVPLIGAGIVPLEAAFAATLGANIGTTVTALLASLTGSPQAVTVALVHTLFNVSGILIIYPIKAVRRIPMRLATGLARHVARKRSFAFLYMIGVFFLMPLIFVMIDKLVRS
jgi:sodium-dependent phosphate cotransporter